jgi:hypothetical protein
VLSKTEIHRLIEEAKSLVADVEEPFKTAAFQVILDRLISSETVVAISEAGVAKKSEEVSESQIPKIDVPDEKMNSINNLGDSDKIPILWSMADKEWMNVDNFLTGVAEAGITIAMSWSPKKGGNFNNRLYKGKKLFVKKGEGKEALYKLSAEGKQKVKEFLDSKGGDDQKQDQ